MKKALIVAGAAIILGSKKEVTVVPCNKTLETTYYKNGKPIHRIIFTKGWTSFYPINFGVRDVYTGKIFYPDSVGIKIK